MRCSKVTKNLSAFIDGELNPQESKIVEAHILECASCNREVEKLREMIGIVGKTEKPLPPFDLWEGTCRKIEESSKSPVGWLVGFRAPRWVLFPAGAVIALLIVYFTASQFIFHQGKTEQVPVTVYLQEHARFYSEQMLPAMVSTELTIAQNGHASDDLNDNEPMSEIDLLMEVHYGVNSTYGS